MLQSQRFRSGPEPDMRDYNGIRARRPTQSARKLDAISWMPELGGPGWLRLEIWKGRRGRELVTRIIRTLATATSELAGCDAPACGAPALKQRTAAAMRASVRSPKSYFDWFASCPAPHKAVS